MKGGAKVVVVPHKHNTVFIAKAKEDALRTKNMLVGESIYGEKRVSVHVHACSLLPLGRLSCVWRRLAHGKPALIRRGQRLRFGYC